MAVIMRYRVAWSGTALVGPGVSTFYFDQASIPEDVQAATKAFFTGCAGAIVVNTSWTFPNGGDLIDDTTGALTGTWTGAASSTLNATAGGNFAAGVGMQIRWDTAGIHNRRRVKGRTFMVPLAASQYDADGTILGGAITGFQNAATAFVGATGIIPLVWSRPKLAVLGASNRITSALAVDKVATLKSRRT